MVDCPLCQNQSEHILWQNEWCRVIAAQEPNQPAVCRVIWQTHVAEMTDLMPQERENLMNVVYAVEQAMRKILQPTKINLASLGNVVPHLHWHIIARFHNDANFPSPVWVNAVRQPTFKLPENWQDKVEKELKHLLHCVQ